MSFWDSYTDLGSGGKFLSAAEKQFLIENGVEFEIVGLQEDPQNSFGPRFVAFLKVPNPETGEEEERKVGFPVDSGVSSRDSMLEAMKGYLDGPDAEPVKVKLSKPGKAILIVAA